MDNFSCGILGFFLGVTVMIFFHQGSTVDGHP